jgi:RNase P/RNase MRP subunit POP5
VFNIDQEKILTLYGDCGYGNCALNTFVRHIDQDSLVYVVRTPKDQFLDCTFALTCITDVKKIPVVLRTLKIASCVRTCLKDLDDIFSEAVKRDSSLTEDGREAEILRARNKLAKLDFS